MYCIGLRCRMPGWCGLFGPDLSAIQHHPPCHPRALAEKTEADYYALLGVDRDASGAQIKAAYHRTLLQHHPDKSKTGEKLDFALLKRAYETLSSAEKRRHYDAEETQRSGSQRPAEIVSLDEWDETEDGVWRFPCRCGRAYVLREADMEAGVHLVGCEGCSEVVWAGYELADEAGAAAS